MSGAESVRRKEGGEGGRNGDVAGHAGPCGQNRGLGFTPRGGGSPGGLWAGDGQDVAQLCQGKGPSHLRWLLQGLNECA